MNTKPTGTQTVNVSRPFWAGDRVKHWPTGETWILANDEENGNVSPCGWPCCLARACDCVMLEAASEAKRLDTLTRWASKADDQEIGEHRVSTARNQLHRQLEKFSLVKHLVRQRRFSEHTFGPGRRTEGVVDHIRKELDEIIAKPDDVEEWIDVVILALDGAWRHGATPEQIIETLTRKQAENEARKWPDWRTIPEGQAICHVRETAGKEGGK